MRVLIADKLSSVGQARLNAESIEVHVDATLKGDTLTAALKDRDPDVLVVRSTRVESDQIGASGALSLIVRAGAGVNTIDLAAASDRGIFIANCPGKNSVAVAELAMGLMLAVDRHIPAGTADLKQGSWNKGRYSAASGLAGRTLGVLGLGGIGRAVAVRASSFDMPVIAWSRSLTKAQAEALGVRRADSPQQLAELADILTVHLALNDDTRGLVDAEMLASLGDNGMLINTSRADVVDSTALMAALDRGLKAGLDVFPDEPSGKHGTFDSPIARHPNVVGTHHIGASTQQAQDAVAHAVADIILGYNTTGEIQNCVNLDRHTRAEFMLVVRHKDRVGVLAAVLDTLRKRQLNVQEMENRIFAGGRAAVANIQISGTAPDDVVTALKNHDHILNVSLVRLFPESK